MRQPKPWYRKFNDTWYVQVGRRQIPLAKGKVSRAEAYERFHELMAQQDIGAAADEAKINVASLCDAFLDWSQRHNAPESFAWYGGFLQDFCDAHGLLTVRGLKPFHVTHWLDAHDWSQSTRRAAITCVKRAINWGVEQGYLTANPLRSLKRPPSTSRQRVITDEEHRRMLDAADEDFARLLTALYETGARPGELAGLTAEHVDLAQRVCVLPHHKTAKKTGAPRVIVLSDAAVELLRPLVERHPAGPLFRNARGRAWNRNSVRLRVRRLRERLGLSADVVAYAYRHTYATNGLANGVPIATMAQLLGHADTKMISAHYAHLGQKLDHLRAAAQQATRRDGCA